MEADSLASAANSACNSWTWALSSADFEAAWSIFEVIFATSSSSSAFFTSVLDICSSQYAFSSASSFASFSNFAIMSSRSPLTFANGSSPPSEPYFTTADIFEASCASAAEWCFLASCWTIVTTSDLARSAQLWMRVATCTKEYDCDTAPELVSSRIVLAFAMAVNSSLREFTVDSWSEATCMHVERAVSSSSSALAKVFLVTARSPSAVALASSAAALVDSSSLLSLLSAAS
mmetsp:Transcript_39610/g.102495  ORF Transcript_39610/g.102495 Transcript_39610/m.102495 type:complete len:233 (-) Transcript_39610:103-801(-)